MELVNDGTGLGFGIVGGKTTGVIVKTILPGGIADQVTTLSWMHHTLVFRGCESRKLGFWKTYLLVITNDFPTVLCP